MLAKQGWQLDLDGFVQADAVPWSEESHDEIDPGTGEALNEESFSLRRALFRARARQGALSVGLEFEGAASAHGPTTARLLGAQVAYSQRYATVAAGLFLVPFGAEVATNARDKVFLEPPAFARALFPGSYDAGVQAAGGYGFARWSVAVVNGAPVGDAQWNGVDPTASYELIGRVGADVPGPRRSRVAADISAMTGQGLHPGTPATKDELQWVDENQDGIVQTTELQVVPGQTAEPSQTFSRHAIGADARVSWCLCALGTGYAFAEGVLATNLDRALVYADPIARSRDVRELGFSIGVVQEVTPWGMVGVRYDRYDADRDAQEREGTDLVGTHQIFSTLSVMGAARWGTARLTAQYDRVRNPFGRGDDGAPRTRAADRFALRAQVMF